MSMVTSLLDVQQRALIEDASLDEGDLKEDVYEPEGSISDTDENVRLSNVSECH